MSRAWRVIEMKKVSHSRVLWIALFGVLLAAGYWLRGLSFAGMAHSPAMWRKSNFVTLYFADGPVLVPVSRRISGSDDLPRKALENLLSGPATGGALTTAIPNGVGIRSIAVSAGVAQVDLSGAFLADRSNGESAANSIVETLTSVPGVHSVALSVEGKSLGAARQRVPLLYFTSARGLVAVPDPAANPREAVSRFLAGPPSANLTGLPSDVRILKYEYAPAERSVALDFTYTPSVRTLALESPERVRFVLLGLIASLTEFPEVESVQLDFDGRTRLGVGQCSDLLRTRQRRPELFNDERLLNR